jgi:hypothetical protein
MKFIVKDKNSEQETSEDKKIISKVTKEDELRGQIEGQGWHSIVTHRFRCKSQTDDLLEKN